MKNIRENLLKIIIIVSVLVILLILGIILLKVNSTPKKIFSRAINTIFVENKNDVKTNRTQIEVSTEMKSSNNEYAEEIQMINEILSSCTFTLNQEADLQNNILNNSISIKNNEDELINAEAIIQNNQLYIYCNDLLDKYVVLPIGEVEEVTNQNVNSEIILNSIKNALQTEIVKQEFIDQKVKLNVNEKTIKTRKVSLQITDTQLLTILKNVLTSLNQDDNFLNNFGENKADVARLILNTIESINREIDNTDGTIMFSISIYTQGIFNKFVKFEITMVDRTLYKELSYNVSFTNIDKKQIIDLETTSDGVTKNILNIVSISDNKNGNATANINIEDMVLVIKCKYLTENNVVVNKKEIINTINEEDISKKDMIQIFDNFQNSKLYKFLQEKGILDLSTLISEKDIKEKPIITRGAYLVEFSKPSDFSLVSLDTESSKKTYKNKISNLVYISIEDTTVEEYMNNLEKDYILQSGTYTNQSLGKISTYKVGEIEYSYRIIVYKEKENNFMKMCFAYDLGNSRTYIVEVEAKQGTITLDTIEQFLNIEYGSTLNYYQVPFTNQSI